LPGGLAFLSTRVGISPRDPQFLDGDYQAEFIAGKALAERNPIIMRSQGRLPDQTSVNLGIFFRSRKLVPKGEVDTGR